jgi:hypothetical protein
MVFRHALMSSLLLAQVALAAGPESPATSAGTAQPAQPAEPVKPVQPAPSGTSVTPYGLLVTNFYYNTADLMNADVPTGTVYSDTRRSALGATVRQSRFGLQIKSMTAASALGAQSAEAVFEIDFFGGYYPTDNRSYYFPLPRLRLFNASIRFEHLKLVAGQDWAIFAPVMAESLTHAAIPGFSGSGNLWARLPQVRAELNGGPFTLAAGVLAAADASPASGTVIASARESNAGDRGIMPSLQARASLTGKLVGDAPATLGVSGHFGREATVAGDNLTSWAAAVDLNLPLGMFAIKGEAYMGANLDGFFSWGSIIAPIDPSEQLIPLETRGGFVQLSFRPGSLGLHAGFGIDRPMPVSGRVLADSTVFHNSAVYLSATYALAPRMNIGVEFNRLETKRIALPTAIGQQVSGAFQFAF